MYNNASTAITGDQSVFTIRYKLLVCFHLFYLCLLVNTEEDFYFYFVTDFFFLSLSLRFF